MYIYIYYIYISPYYTDNLDNVYTHIPTALALQRPGAWGVNAGPSTAGDFAAAAGPKHLSLLFTLARSHPKIWYLRVLQ